LNEPIVHRVPLFSGLPEWEMQHLSAILRESRYPADTTIFHEGDFGDRLYIVIDGQIEIVKALATTEERLVGVRGPGEYFGEMSLLGPDVARTASVRTRTAVHLAEIGRTRFHVLLDQHPALAYKVACVLTTRLQESDNATISDLQAKNRQLAEANEALKAAQAKIVEKEKLEHELQLARQIQESMLPRLLPERAGFDFGARFAPAYSVGGDCFDFISLARDSIGIVVGDVSGKGVPAALFMALTRSLLRAEGSRAASPRETLQNVNRHLSDMNEAGMFVTVLYGVLNEPTGAFAYVRAGHEVPLVVEADGTIIQPSPGPGQPLGVIPNPDLIEQTIVIPPGGTLLMYTDGVTDALDSDGVFFGLERLREALSAHRHCTAQGLCDRLLQAVREHQGSAPQHDDIALVAVQGRAGESSAGRPGAKPG
jgi:serine phosphatase RsbU (regulator of sigma subunit)